MRYSGARREIAKIRKILNETCGLNYLSVKDANFMLDKICEALVVDEKSNGWIPVSERLPEEHDSIFAKFKGTDNWKRGMFEKTSKYVIATVAFDDGTVLVEQAHTTDGIWRTDKKFLGGTVVAWMDYPEPYKED